MMNARRNSFLVDMMNARRNSFLVDICYMFRQYFAPKGSDKICMMMTRLACNRVLRARIGEWTIT
jgi:hypothetical protein